MSDHDYVKSDEHCPDCGSVMLADVVYNDDSVGSAESDRTVCGLDCQGRMCGSQFTKPEWAKRIRA
jgi:ribosomal protein S27AE